MGGVGKHIGDASAFQLVAFFVNQDRSIPGQGSWFAGDIDDALGRCLVEGLNQSGSAIPGRVDQHLVKLAQGRKAFRRGFKQIGDTVFAAIFQTVQNGVGPGAVHQFLAALNPDDGGAAAGDGQGEVAQAAEHIGNALAGLGLEQGHGAMDQ